MVQLSWSRGIAPTTIQRSWLRWAIPPFRWTPGYGREARAGQDQDLCQGIGILRGSLKLAWLIGFVAHSATI